MKIYHYKRGKRLLLCYEQAVMFSKGGYLEIIIKCLGAERRLLANCFLHRAWGPYWSQISGTHIQSQTKCHMPVIPALRRQRQVNPGDLLATQQN